MDDGAQKSWRLRITDFAFDAVLRFAVAVRVIPKTMTFFLSLVKLMKIFGLFYF